ncbi:MAG: DMT family transporter [Oscillospiraceae bacterium]|nr:DMT family transporter [Oscillospiraceae bacterium]
MKSTGIEARICLFAAALIWGSSFVVVKDAVDVFSPFMLLAFRFTIGCLLLAFIFRRKLSELNKKYFINSGIIGFCLFTAYGLQTIGITDTTPGKNAFLTAVYCVLVPFLFWITDKVKPDVFNFSAAVMCIIGIGLVSLDGDLSIRMGDALTLAGGFFYAAHMVAVAKFSKGADPVLITILQFGYCAVFSWIVGGLFEQLPAVWTMRSTLGMLYLAVFATAVALLFQVVGQKNTPPAEAAIILSLESVLGVVFSMLLYGEQLTVRLFCGFVMIFAAVIVSETKLSFLFKKSAPAAKTELE